MCIVKSALSGYAQLLSAAVLLTHAHLQGKSCTAVCVAETGLSSRSCALHTFKGCCEFHVVTHPRTCACSHKCHWILCSVVRVVSVGNLGSTREHVTCDIAWHELKDATHRMHCLLPSVSKLKACSPLFACAPQLQNCVCQLMRQLLRHMLRM